MLTLEVLDFYLCITQDAAQTARMKITSADVTKGTIIELKHILRRQPTADGKRNLTYEFEVTINNNQQRNLCYELLEIFRRFGVIHLNFVSNKFNSKVAHYVESVSNLLFPKGSDSGLLSQFDILFTSAR